MHMNTFKESESISTCSLLSKLFFRTNVLRNLFLVNMSWCTQRGCQRKAYTIQSRQIHVCSRGIVLTRGREFRWE